MSRSPQLDNPRVQSEYAAAFSGTYHLVRRGKSFSGREQNCAFINTRGPTFANASAVSGLDFADDGRAMATVDWDHDGDLDLWLRNRTGPRLRLMRNQTIDGDEKATDFVAMFLKGTNCNRDAIGARVEVVLKDRTQGNLVQTLHAGDAFLSQSSKWLHFGLGAGQAIEQVRVHWPGGKWETFDGIAAGGRYLMTEGSGSATPWQRPVVADKLAAADQPMESFKGAHGGTFLPMRIPLPSLPYRPATSQKLETIQTNGTPLLVLFWSRSCHTCLKEMKELAEAKQRLQEAGINVLALNVDELDGQDTDETAENELLERIGFSFAHGGAVPELLHKYEILQEFLFDHVPQFAVPAGWLIDQKGRLAAVYRGPVDVETLLYDAGNLNATPQQLLDISVPFAGRWYTGPVPEKKLFEWVADAMARHYPADAKNLRARAAGQR